MRNVVVDLVSWLERRVLAVLGVAVASLVLVHALLFLRTEYGGPARERFIGRSPWSIETERGVGALFGYLLAALVVALAVALHRRERQAVLVGWAALFAVVTADDSLQLHERIGSAVAGRGLLPDLLGVSAQSLGELVAWALLGGVPVLLVAVLHRRSNRRGRRVSAVIAALFVALLCCAVVLDLVHGVVGGERRAFLVGILEDGGELLVLSLLVAVLSGLLRAPRAVRAVPARNTVLQPATVTAPPPSATGRAARDPLPVAGPARDALAG